VARKRLKSGAKYPEALVARAKQSPLTLLMPGVRRANDVNDAAARTTLQFLQIFLTEGRTFISYSRCPAGWPFSSGPHIGANIKCDCVWATKSITPTTMINNEVPPNWNGTLGFTMRMISGSKHHRHDVEAAP